MVVNIAIILIYFEHNISKQYLKLEDEEQTSENFVLQNQQDSALEQMRLENLEQENLRLKYVSILSYERLIFISKYIYLD